MTGFPSRKAHFARSLAAAGERIHLAAHSHHLWPDASHDGHMAAWRLAAEQFDAKWDAVFAELIPAAQRHVAGHLNLPDPTTIAFGPNTHDFLRRLLSACPSLSGPAGRPPRVLTTDGEFHTASRQFARLAEDGLLSLVVVPTQPFASFLDRFATAARAAFDLVLVSQVFFESGHALPLADLVACLPEADTLVAIDGYHGFMALPTDLGPVAGRAFYMAGGYKYAMAGEGVCFLHCPPGVAPRPRDTGWYAGFGALAQGGGVGYGQDASRFLGATFDPSGLCRLVAVMDWLAAIGETPASLHARAHALQSAFVAALRPLDLEGLRETQLVVPLGAARGNFLAYRSPAAPDVQRRLALAGITTDVRRDVLRVGFGLYHDLDDIAPIAARIARALA